MMVTALVASTMNCRVFEVVFLIRKINCPACPPTTTDPTKTEFELPTEAFDLFIVGSLLLSTFFALPANNTSSTRLRCL